MNTFLVFSRIGKFILGGIMLTKRQCSEKDRMFVYKVMKENMEDHFNKNTPEGWNDEKFHAGFDPNRITILEIGDNLVGFYDIEEVNGQNPFLYVHNVQTTKEKRGFGLIINRIIDEEARSRNLRTIRAKVFRDNIRSITFCEYMGYSVISDSSLDQENSVYVEKTLTFS